MTPDDNPLCDGDPLARQLAALAPAPSALTRDQLMFAAGSASRDRDVRFWKRLASAQPAGLAAVLLGLFLLPGEPRTSMADGTSPVGPTPTLTPPPPVMASVTPLPLPADSGDPALRAKYVQLRADVFAVGLNVLPTPTAPPNVADPDKLEKELHLPRGVFADHARRPMPPPE